MRAVVERSAELRGLSREALHGGRLFASESCQGSLEAAIHDHVLTIVDAPEDGGSVGRLYETLIAHRVDVSRGSFALVPGRHRRTSGSFFTPAEISSQLVREVLGPRLLSLSKHEQTRCADGLLSLRVCDPAMGAGAFLIEVAEQIAAELTAARGGSSSSSRADAGLRSAVVRSCLFGVDVSSRAVAVAEAALWLFASDPELSLREAGQRLLSADALRSEIAFAEAGFDLVVGNPPWIAFAGRAAQPLPDEHRAEYSRRYAAWRGYPTLHGLFIERAAELAPGGSIALLVPSPVADLQGYGPTRRALTRSHRVREPLVEFGQDAFPGVTQPCFALVAEPLPSRGDGSIAPWRLAERTRISVEAELVRPPAVLGLLGEARKLPPELFREMGLQTTKEATEQLLLRAAAPDERHAYPLLEGKDVREYWQGPPRLFLNADRELTARARCRVRPRSDYGVVRFVVRQTAKAPIAARHGGLPFRNSLLAGMHVESLDDDFVVALLNSALYRAVHIAGQRDARQAAFPQVKISHLRTLPRPPFDARLWALISQLSVQAHAEGGAGPLLKPLIDEAVFDLFRLPCDHREVVLGFVASRVPELGHARPSTSVTATSSLEPVQDALATVTG
jgi:SAM-dependent methyltransferase